MRNRRHDWLAWALNRTVVAVTAAVFVCVLAAHGLQPKAEWQVVEFTSSGTRTYYAVERPTYTDNWSRITFRQPDGRRVSLRSLDAVFLPADP
jgi:hypothetical protein